MPPRHDGAVVVHRFSLLTVDAAWAAGMVEGEPWIDHRATASQALRPSALTTTCTIGR